jgi:hypothetical protein
VDAQRDPTLHHQTALDHNYLAIVVCGDVDGHTHDEVGAWFRDTYLPEAMAQPWGRPGGEQHHAAARRPSRRRGAAGPGRAASCSSTSSTTTPRRWADSFAKIGEAIEASGLATRVDRPVHQTDFGTDTHRRSVVPNGRQHCSWSGSSLVA